MYIFEDGFEVRIARNTEEIKVSQKLRYEVFIEEMGGYTQSEASELQLERDKFDEHCQHLLLIDRNKKVGKSDGKVVGVMRLMLGSEAELGQAICKEAEGDIKSAIDVYQRLTNSISSSIQQRTIALLESAKVDLDPLPSRPEPVKEPEKPNTSKGIELEKNTPTPLDPEAIDNK